MTVIYAEGRHGKTEQVTVGEVPLMGSAVGVGAGF